MTAASNSAEAILTQLGQDVTLPTLDLSSTDYDPPDHSTDGYYDLPDDLAITDLTEGVVGGEGTFDKIMTSHMAHLRDQYDKGYISQAEFSAVYIQLTSLAMQSGMDFLFRARESVWSLKLAKAQAEKADIEAVIARVQLDTAKYQLAAAAVQQELLKAQTALVTMQLATEDAKYDLALLQQDMVKEQTESQRAQTLDTRTDGAAVKGSVGKQKELYSEQISSYKKDAQQKFLRSMLDTWITQKSIDEGLTAPTALSNTEISEVVNSVRAAVDLGN